MAAEQRTNLKFLTRLRKSPSDALCMLQEASGNEALFRSKVFFSGTKDSKKDVRMLKMISGVDGLLLVEVKPMFSL